MWPDNPRRYNNVRRKRGHRAPMSFVVNAWISERDDELAWGGDVRPGGRRRPNNPALPMPGFTISYDPINPLRVCFESTAINPTGQATDLNTVYTTGPTNNKQNYTGPDTCVEYPDYGTYTVTQTVTDPNTGLTANITQTVNLQPPGPPTGSIDAQYTGNCPAASNTTWTVDAAGITDANGTPYDQLPANTLDVTVEIVTESDTSTQTATYTGTPLTFTTEGFGNATITVTATDLRSDETGTVVGTFVVDRPEAQLALTDVLTQLHFTYTGSNASIPPVTTLDASTTVLRDPLNAVGYEWTIDDPTAAQPYTDQLGFTDNLTGRTARIVPVGPVTTGATTHVSLRVQDNTGTWHGPHRQLVAIDGSNSLPNPAPPAPGRVTVTDSAPANATPAVVEWEYRFYHYDPITDVKTAVAVDYQGTDVNTVTQTEPGHSFEVTYPINDPAFDPLASRWTAEAHLRGDNGICATSSTPVTQIGGELWGGLPDDFLVQGDYAYTGPDTVDLTATVDGIADNPDFEVRWHLPGGEILEGANQTDVVVPQIPGGFPWSVTVCATEISTGRVECETIDIPPAPAPVPDVTFDIENSTSFIDGNTGTDFGPIRNLPTNFDPADIVEIRWTMENEYTGEVWGAVTWTRPANDTELDTAATIGTAAFRAIEWGTPPGPGWYRATAVMDIAWPPEYGGETLSYTATDGTAWQVAGPTAAFSTALTGTYGKVNIDDASTPGSAPIATWEYTWQSPLQPDGTQIARTSGPMSAGGDIPLADFLVLPIFENTATTEQRSRHPGGDWSVTLSVTDQAGQSDTVTQTVTIPNPRPPKNRFVSGYYDYVNQTYNVCVRFERNEIGTDFRWQDILEGPTGTYINVAPMNGSVGFGNDIRIFHGGPTGKELFLTDQYPTHDIVPDNEPICFSLHTKYLVNGPTNGVTDDDYLNDPESIKIEPGGGPRTGLTYDAIGQTSSKWQGKCTDYLFNSIDGRVTLWQTSIIPEVPVGQPVSVTNSTLTTPTNATGPTATDGALSVLPTIDVLPHYSAVVDGTLTVRDATGNVVATRDVTRTEMRDMMMQQTGEPLWADRFPPWEVTGLPPGDYTVQFTVQHHGETGQQPYVTTESTPEPVTIGGGAIAPTAAPAATAGYECGGSGLQIAVELDSSASLTNGGSAITAAQWTWTGASPPAIPISTATDPLTGPFTVTGTADAGTHPYSLTVTNADGAQHTATGEVTVQAAAPIADNSPYQPSMEIAGHPELRMRKFPAVAFALRGPAGTAIDPRVIAHTSPENDADVLCNPEQHYTDLQALPDTTVGTSTTTPYPLHGELAIEVPLYYDPCQADPYLVVSAEITFREAADRTLVGPNTQNPPNPNDATYTRPACDAGNGPDGVTGCTIRVGTAAGYARANEEAYDQAIVLAEKPVPTVPATTQPPVGKQTMHFDVSGQRANLVAGWNRCHISFGNWQNRPGTLLLHSVQLPWNTEAAFCMLMRQTNFVESADVGQTIEYIAGCRMTMEAPGPPPGTGGLGPDPGLLIKYSDTQVYRPPMVQPFMGAAGISWRRTGTGTTFDYSHVGGPPHVDLKQLPITQSGVITDPAPTYHPTDNQRGLQSGGNPPGRMGNMYLFVDTTAETKQQILDRYLNLAVEGTTVPGSNPPVTISTSLLGGLPIVEDCVLP